MDDLFDASVPPIDLVDDEHDRQVGLECLAQDEPGLGEGSFRRVDQEEDPVDHREPPLDLAAEIYVARGVDDVEGDPGVSDRGVLGEDGDALLALEVSGVEHPLVDGLVRPKGA